MVQDTSGLCQGPKTRNILATPTVSGATYNLTFTNINDGIYQVVILGTKGTTTAQILSQTFYVFKVSKNQTVGWCNNIPINDQTFKGTTVYTTKVPSFVFGTAAPVPDFLKTQLTQNGEYFETKYSLFTNEFLLPNQTKLTSSQASAQLITFSVIPEKPVQEGIKDK